MLLCSQGSAPVGVQEVADNGYKCTDSAPRSSDSHAPENQANYRKTHIDDLGNTSPSDMKDNYLTRGMRAARTRKTDGLYLRRNHESGVARVAKHRGHLF